MDDSISRQAAIDVVFSEPLYESGMKKRGADAVVPAIYEKIKSLPSAQPERKKGTWINEGRIIRCNKCKIGYATVKGMKSALTYNFCPNCGAKMEGEQNEQ